MSDEKKLQRSNSFKVCLSGLGLKVTWLGLFSVYPQGRDIEEAIRLDVTALQASGREHELEEAKGLLKLLEIVKLLSPISTPGESQDVMVAGVLVGRLNIFHEAMFIPYVKTPVEKSPWPMSTLMKGDAK